MMTDLERACKALAGKRVAYNRYWKYYNGDQPVVYTSKRLKDIFRDVNAKFTENWCAVVVDSVMDRIRLKGFTVSGAEAAQKKLTELWSALSLALEADDAHEAALVTGEAYVIAWREDEGLEVYFNDPRLCHVFYAAEKPRSVRFAAKWWDAEDEKRRLTLYYSDHLEYYISRGKGKNAFSAKAFMPLEPEPVVENPFKRVPVFHLRTKRRAVSEMDNAIPLQNGVNKLLIDMMVAAEYGAFKQRYIISNAEILGKLKNAPNEIWDLAAGDGLGQATQVGEFSATDLDNYIKAVNSLAQAIGVITRTPKHYFYVQSGDPSGEALIAMEAALNNKAKDRIARFAPVWRQLAIFLLYLSGIEIEASAVEAVFERVETVQPYTQAQTRQLDVGSGIPLHTTLREEGRSEEWLAQMGKDKQAEREAGARALASALLSAQRNFDQEE